MFNPKGAVTKTTISFLGWQFCMKRQDKMDSTFQKHVNLNFNGPSIINSNILEGFSPAWS